MKINESTYQLVEKVLSKYPISWQKNYYQNKKNLIVVYEESEVKSVSADYNHEKNIITIYDSKEEFSAHELFHMAFRDEDKVEKRITKKAIYSNGVSFENPENEIIYLKGVTEGFAEFLSRYCKLSKGHTIEYFFIDLLISIYGEEILEYPFQNDPMGFLMDNSFFDIVTFSKNLDCYYKSTEVIQIINAMRSELEQQMMNDEDAKNTILNCMEKNMESFNKSIIATFDSIIAEYVSSKEPRIKKELFIKKVSSFLTNPDYAIAFSLNEHKFGVKKSLQKSIDSLKRW